MSALDPSLTSVVNNNSLPSVEETESSFWSLPTHELFQQLNSSPEGLAYEEAIRRLKIFGPNSVQTKINLEPFWLLLRQYQNPLVLVLVSAALISLVLQDWVEATIILVIVLGSTLLGFSQEYRANRSMFALKQQLALTTHTRRNGRLVGISVEDIVPGDIVYLSAGNLVPADGLILEAKDFMVVEGALTGESFPVEKKPGLVAASEVISKRNNSAFLGTSVRSGTATVLVVKTGRNTIYGRIATQLRSRQPETNFMRGVRNFGYMLVRIVVILALFSLVANLFIQRPLTDTLLFSLALAVGISPELLPAIVSVTLSAGARRMADHGVIVRRLEAIENLGSMEVLCVDKTGTITKGEMEFCAWIDPHGNSSEWVKYLAYCNAWLESGIENPLDAAIIFACRGDSQIDSKMKVDEIPYDFHRKRLTVVIDNQDSGRHLIITKGAFDCVLDVCTRLRSGEDEMPLMEEARERIKCLFQQNSEQGFRALAIATKQIVAKLHYGHDDETEMTFEGLLLFADPLKPDIKSTIERLRQLGVTLKIITGDNRFVSSHIASEVGIDTRSILTGADLEKMSDEALRQRTKETDLFVEIDPQGKERIIRLLRQSGSSVGYLGDGINDAPALHAADLGISVDKAVDVARESADIVLLKSDLSVLCVGIDDGRHAFANTQKYLRISTSTNFGNMISMALASPALPFLPMLVPQILLNNLLSDMPMLALAGDNVDESARAHPQRWKIEELQNFMIVFGLVSTIFDLLTFGILLIWFDAEERVFQTAWFVLSVLTELFVILILRSRLPFYRTSASSLLIGLIAIITIVTVALPFYPNNFLMLVPIPAHITFALTLILAVYLFATEFIKVRYFKT